MKVEITSLNPTMCREWVEKPDRDKYYTGSRDLLGEVHDQIMWEVYDRDLSLYNQRIASLPTYLLISDKEYKVGDVVEVELQWHVKQWEAPVPNFQWVNVSEELFNNTLDPYRRIIAIPVQQEVREVEAVRFRDDLQVGVDRILRDKGASNKDVYDAINDVVIELSKEYNITKKVKQ